MQTLKTGATLQDGKYKIMRVLGQGGFGITYLAENQYLGSQVAIKEFFFKQYCERDESTSHVTVGTQSAKTEVSRYQEKFMKEARTIARLNHPNITKIHDVFKENNTAYFVMDYLRGENLSECIKHQGRLSESVAIDYIRQVGNALSYIHTQNLNHLDVKPSNIMITDNGRKAVLIDFGTSKQYDAISGNQTSTTPAGVSHGYAPIEQYKEGGVREFSPQTDIYSLGATLYKLITGNTPPQATEIIVDGWNPVYPQEITAETRAAIGKAMETRKVNRPGKIDTFLNLLGRPSNHNGEHRSTPVNDNEDTQINIDYQQLMDAQRQKEREKEEIEAKRRLEEEKKKIEQRKKEEGEIHWSKKDPKKLDTVYHDSVGFIYGGILAGSVLTIIFALIRILSSQDFEEDLNWDTIPCILLGILGLMGSLGLRKRESGSVFLCLLYSWLCTISNAFGIIISITEESFPNLLSIAWLIFGFILISKLHTSADIKQIFTKEYRKLSGIQILLSVTNIVYQSIIFLSVIYYICYM